MTSYGTNSSSRSSGKDARGARHASDFGSELGRSRSGPTGDNRRLLQSGHGDPLSSWLENTAREFREFDLNFDAGRSLLSGSERPVSLFSDSRLSFPSSASRGYSSQQAGLYPESNSLHQSLLGSERPSLASSWFNTLPASGQLSRQPQSYNRQDRISNLKMNSDKELSPKAKVSYDQEKFEVEFNVQEFKPEELSIKTEGDVLIVLGKQEVKEGGQTYVSKQFEQRFSLPSGVKPESITSALSKDGYLTVTAPREQAAIKGKTKQAIEGTAGEVFQQSQQTKGDGLPHPKVKYDDDKFQISLDAKDYKPDELDVKVEGNTIIITAKQEIQESGGTRTRVFEQKFSLPSGVKADKVSSALSKDGVLTITAPRGNPAANQSYTHSIENTMNKVMSPSKWDDDYRKDSTSSIKSGRHDSLFDTPSAISARSNSLFDDTSFFDRNRTGSIFDNETSMFAANSEQSGVSRVEYDNQTYKIHVNVDGFKPEELIVKTVDNTVQVEAKHEEKTTGGNSYSTRSFQQSFTLPRGVNLESVSSALSKEGILTISAPLPPSIEHPNSERLVPIKHH